MAVASSPRTASSSWDSVSRRAPTSLGLRWRCSASAAANDFQALGLRGNANCSIAPWILSHRGCGLRRHRVPILVEILEAGIDRLPLDAAQDDDLIEKLAHLLLRRRGVEPIKALA